MNKKRGKIEGVEGAWIRGFAAALSFVVHSFGDHKLVARALKHAGLSREQLRAADTPVEDMEQINKVFTGAPVFHVYGDRDVSAQANRSSCGFRLYRTDSVDGDPSKMEPTLVMVLGTRHTERDRRGREFHWYSFEGLDPVKVGIPVSELDATALYLGVLEAQIDQQQFTAAWESRGQKSSGRVVTMQMKPVQQPGVLLIKGVEDLRRVVCGDDAAASVQQQNEVRRAWHQHELEQEVNP